MHDSKTAANQYYRSRALRSASPLLLAEADLFYVSMTSVELRCPVGARRLLGKLLSEGGQPTISDNLMELACKDCAKNAREFDPSVRRVLHRFSAIGELVESVVER